MMRPVPSLGRCPQRCLAAYEAAHQVDVDDPAEVLLGKVREHRGRDGAGVVDQDVQCAAAEFGRGGGGFGRRSRVAHVEDERLGGTAGRGDRFRGGHRGVLVDVGHQHRGPGRGESAGNRLRRRRCPRRSPAPSGRRAGRRHAAGSSVAPRQAQHVLSQVVEHHLLADRGDAGQPGLAEIPGDVVLLGVAHAAVCLQCAVGRVERGVGA